jgi:hypothetical protein
MNWSDMGEEIISKLEKNVSKKYPSVRHRKKII